MTANESEIGGTPGCNDSDVETETHTHTQGGATSTTLAHAAESGPFSAPELQKWKQQGGEIYAESTGRNEGNEMQSEAEGKKSYHHPPPCPSKSMLFFANWRLAGIQI